MLYLYHCFLRFPERFCRKTCTFAYKISSTMVKAILLSLVMTWGLCVSAQIDENLQAQLNVLRDSCAAAYNQKELLPFIEKYKGKEVWLTNNVGENRIAKIWKRQTGISKHHRWLNCHGTCKSAISSGMLGSLNDLRGINCICQGIMLIPNLQTDIQWEPVGSDLLYPKRLPYFCEYEHNEMGYHGEAMFKKNQFRHEKKGLMFEYYAVFTINPSKTYKYASSKDSLTIANADTLFIPYSKELYKYIKLNYEFQALMKQHENWEQVQWNKYNRMEAARYQYAKEQWGERIADKIQHGLLEFGFSSEMCIQARREEPYKIDKVTTPFGLATRYDFYQSNMKLYFIDDQLIGIQTKEQSPLYYM